MKGKHNRVGIIASTALAQHQLEWVIADAGYEVAVNTSPERLNKLFLANETIRLWVVELAEDGQWSELLQDILDLTQAPILFGDGQIPAKNHQDYPRWCKRMQKKMHAFAPVLQAAVSAPQFDLDVLMRCVEKPRFELPESLKNAPNPDLGPIWILCASLGGPQAVKDFLDLLPLDIPATFLYAQHIDAGCLAALVQSVGRHAALTMTYAEHGLSLVNGQVAVVPVDHEILFANHPAVLWQDREWSGPYGPSHDQLLKNAAEHFGRQCNAIIFSGMGSDGTLGSALVKEMGGTVWAQATESCVQSSMPDAADQAGSVDWRGSPAQMAEKLIVWLAQRQTQTA
ncbi:chemotaxis protein CheB [Reinekea forsetii]|uniref:chemotaxis protein CheB n=1 Tax=Reinekea forsetii TaxID=1336806 RepID=UPI002355E863|nr:chemotaxis protein CheB [Reinekea forsetii]